MKTENVCWRKFRIMRNVKEPSTEASGEGTSNCHLILFRTIDIFWLVYKMAARNVMPNRPNACNLAALAISASLLAYFT